MAAKCVLLIDDEKYLSSVIRVCLEKLGGWRVLTAESGREGLQLAQSEQPDAILLDVMMPDMDGFAVLQALKEVPYTQNIPVIVLTAKVQPFAPEDDGQFKIAGVLAKPFDPMTLAQQVATMLNWS